MAVKLVTGYKGKDHVTAEQWADFNRGGFSGMRQSFRWETRWRPLFRPRTRLPLKMAWL